MQVCSKLARWCLKVLSHCLEALGGWIGEGWHKVRLNSYGVWDLLKTCPLWIWKGQTELHNFEVHVNSQLLLDEQVAVAARRVFAELHLVHQLYLFLDQEALITLTHALVISIGLLQSALHGAALEDHLDYASGPKCNMVDNYGHATFHLYHVIALALSNLLSAIQGASYHLYHL